MSTHFCYARLMNTALFFQGGTLVVGGAHKQQQFPPPFQWVKERWRCEGYHYGPLVPWLREQGIRDLVPRWKPLECALHDTREPHAYQIAALDAWDEASRRGSVVLPTGAGKTFVAIHAINRVARSALVVAPTIDLLHQWYARLANAFQAEVGVFYSGEKRVLPLTVTTYHSAGDLVADYGQEFKLIIFDEFCVIDECKLTFLSCLSYCRDRIPALDVIRDYLTLFGL